MAHIRNQLSHGNNNFYTHELKTMDRVCLMSIKTDDVKFIRISYSAQAVATKVVEYCYHFLSHGFSKNYPSHSYSFQSPFDF